MKLFGYSFFEKRDTIYVSHSNDPSVYRSGEDVVNKISINETSAMKLSAVMACVRVKSQAIAALPFNFHYKNDKGDSFVANDSVAQLLMKQPNQYMTPFDFKVCMISCKMLYGNGYAMVVRDSNKIPKQLIPINPQRVEVKVSDGGDIYYLIDHKISISYADMVHIKGINTDGIVGISVIKAEAENFGLALAAQNELKNFYEKGSKLDGFISFPNKLNADKSVIEGKAAQKYSGGNATRIGILDNGASFVKVGINPQEAMWLEMMGYGVKEICRMFGVPPHLIQELQESTNNNIEHQGMDFVNHCILPEVKCFEEELDRKILTIKEMMKGYYCKFNMNGLLRGDSQARAELYRALDIAGAISSNEIRRLEDMNGYDGGDVYFRQLNQMDATKITEYYLNAEASNNDKKRSKEIDDILQIIESRNLEVK